MNELETQLIIGAIVAIPIVIALGWALSAIVMSVASNYAWESRKNSYKYEHILK